MVILKIKGRASNSHVSHLCPISREGQCCNMSGECPICVQNPGKPTEISLNLRNV
jgi:hypothetical protein